MTHTFLLSVLVLFGLALVALLVLFLRRSKMAIAVFVFTIALGFYIANRNASDIIQAIVNFTGIAFVETADHVDSAANLIKELEIFFKDNPKVKEIGRAGANPYLYLIFLTQGEITLSASELSEMKKLAENSYSKRVYVNFYNLEQIGEDYNYILEEPKYLQIRIK